MVKKNGRIVVDWWSDVKKHFFIIFLRENVHLGKKRKFVKVSSTVHFWDGLENNAEKTSKKVEKSTYFGQKVAVRGSDDKNYFFIIFLHEKLHLGKKTERKFIFQARARKYFSQFSEAKSSFRKNRRKTGKTRSRIKNQRAEKTQPRK